MKCRVDVLEDCGKEIQRSYCEMMNQGHKVILPECKETMATCGE